MEEALSILKGTKEAQYLHLKPQIAALMTQEEDLIANMGNICAALKEQFDWFWIGFYRVVASELVVGPFQGTIACTRIKKGRGVCGCCWEKEETLIVPNVNEFPGHIACSAHSKSEIVVPVFQNGKVIAVLDIDHNQLNAFDETDKRHLEEIAGLLTH